MPNTCKPHTDHNTQLSVLNDIGELQQLIINYMRTLFNIIRFCLLKVDRRMCPSIRQHLFCWSNEEVILAKRPLPYHQ